MLFGREKRKCANGVEGRRTDSERRGGNETQCNEKEKQKGWSKRCGGGRALGLRLMRSSGVVFLPLPDDRVTRGGRWGWERKL